MKTVIFDFDGTIADNLSVVIDIYNQISEKYGTEKIAKNEIAVYRSMKPLEILKKLKITTFKSPFILRAIRKQMKKQIEKIPVYDGISDVLNKLKNGGFTLGILSSNSVGNIKAVLANYQIDFFDYIFSCNNIFGKHKSLKKFLDNYNLNKEDVIYIGDEIRDIDASRKTGVGIISVCWGYNDRDSLYAENPRYCVLKPADLFDYIN